MADERKDGPERRKDSESRACDTKSPAAANSKSKSTEKDPNPDGFYSWKQLEDRVPYSRTHIDRLEKAGQFPKRRKLRDLPNGRVAWRKDEFKEWSDSRPPACAAKDKDEENADE